MTIRESTDASAAVPTPAPRRAPSGAVADVVLTVLLLALFGWGFLEAAQWSFRAALFPRIVTGGAFVLAALHLGHALLRLRRRAALTSDGSADTLDEDADDAVQLFRTAGPQRWAAALAWVGGFFVLLFVGGLFVTAPVFSLLYLRFAGGRTWVFSAVYAVVTGVVLYLAFEVALGVPTPPGLFLN
jgi:hypothetical protein